MAPGDAAPTESVPPIAGGSFEDAAEGDPAQLATNTIFENDIARVYEVPHATPLRM